MAHEGAPTKDSFSGWVRTLATQRLEDYRASSAAEQAAILIVQRSFLPRLEGRAVDERSAVAAWRESLADVLEAKADPQTIFFATRFVHWMGGLALGCCAGFKAWVSTRPARIHETEVASQLTRMKIRELQRIERDSNTREAYARFVRKMGYLPHDVHSIAQVTDALIRETRKPSPAQIVACDGAWHFAGAFHEGAWMTLGMIRTAPRPVS